MRGRGRKARTGARPNVATVPSVVHEEDEDEEKEVVVGTGEE